VGEVIVGGTAPVLPNDLFIATSLTGYEWPVNGYVTGTLNGGGVYGSVIGSTNGTAFSSIQGEHLGSGAGAGVYGIRNHNSAGSAYASGLTRSGVNSFNYWGNAYCFGVSGATWNDANRHGGVWGGSSETNPATAWGSLGYRNSGGTHYGICYIGGATTTAKYSSDAEIPSVAVGMGGYGDFMGGWTRGNIYGMSVKGNRYSLYVDGRTFANDVISQLNLNATGQQRIVTYVPTSTSVDVYVKGTATMQNGKAMIRFDENFKNIISEKNLPVITVTPMGASNGIYIESISSDGFAVAENNNGTSNVSISWIAVGTKKGYEILETPAELLSNEFDSRLNDFMFNENNIESNAGAMWWDGKTLRFDSPPQPSSVPKYSPDVVKRIGVRNTGQ
jgi:hypothetical protein